MQTLLCRLWTVHEARGTCHRLLYLRPKHTSSCLSLNAFCQEPPAPRTYVYILISSETKRLRLKNWLVLRGVGTSSFTRMIPKTSTTVIKPAQASSPFQLHIAVCIWVGRNKALLSSRAFMPSSSVIVPSQIQVKILSTVSLQQIEQVIGSEPANENLRPRCLLSGFATVVQALSHLHALQR